MELKPIVLSYATQRNAGVERLEQSCKRFGWDVCVFGEGDEWRGWADRLRKVWRKARDFRKAGFTHAIHVDAFDVVAIGSVDELRAAIYAASVSNPPLLLATELNCWPDRSVADKLPPNPSPWRYPHSQFLLDLERMDEVEFVKDIPDGADDQGWLTSKYLEKGPPTIDLDYSCVVFQSVAFAHPWWAWFDVGYGHAFIKNRVTGTSPLFLHGNGGTDISWAFSTPSASRES